MSTFSIVAGHYTLGTAVNDIYFVENNSNDENNTDKKQQNKMIVLTHRVQVKQMQYILRLQLLKNRSIQ